MGASHMHSTFPTSRLCSVHHGFARRPKADETRRAAACMQSNSIPTPLQGESCSSHVLCSLRLRRARVAPRLRGEEAPNHVWHVGKGIAVANVPWPAGHMFLIVRFPYSRCGTSAPVLPQCQTCLGWNLADLGGHGNRSSKHWMLEETP
jgi:hypothetical protein